MTINTQSKIFGAYTKYYDLLYAEKAYSAESNYIHQLIQQHNHGASRILDIGCGTGAHGEELVKLGYTLLGIDLSPEMLTSARERASRLPQSISKKIVFNQGDARTFRTNLRFDVVTSLFHVMSYQTGNLDITAAFETAANHLLPGGLFIFDFWYGPGVMTSPPEVRVRRLKDEKTQVIRIAEPIVDINRNVVEVNYEIHVTDEFGIRVVINEKHCMRYFFLPELELMLNSAGFEVLEELEWMTNRPPNQQTWSAVFCCRLKN